MKKEFEAVEIELVLFSTDVIVTSGFGLPTDDLTGLEVSL